MSIEELNPGRCLIIGHTAERMVEVFVDFVKQAAPEDCARHLQAQNDQVLLEQRLRLREFSISGSVASVTDSRGSVGTLQFLIDPSGDTMVYGLDSRDAEKTRLTAMAWDNAASRPNRG